MRFRLILTSVWIGGLIINLSLVEAYTFVRIRGVRILLQDDIEACVRPLITIYGSYIAGILTFWFAKRFKNNTPDKAENVRYALAMVCTLVLNAILTFYVARTFIDPASFGSVEADINRGVRIAGWLSFLVAPVNLYFFGKQAKKRQAPGVPPLS